MSTSKTIHDTLKTLKPFMAGKKLPPLHGVRVDVLSGGVTLSASDRYVAASVWINSELPIPDTNFFLPAASVTSIIQETRLKAENKNTVAMEPADDGCLWVNGAQIPVEPIGRTPDIAKLVDSLHKLPRVDMVLPLNTEHLKAFAGLGDYAEMDFTETKPGTPYLRATSSFGPGTLIDAIAIGLKQ